MISTVLIIDDEEKLRNLLSRIIKSEGHEVIGAADCKSGLKKIEQNDIDVVFCDVKLPDGNGVDLTIKLKTKSPFTEVILLTAFGNISDGVQAMKNGAFDYIVKGDDNNKIYLCFIGPLKKLNYRNGLRNLKKELVKNFLLKL
jgi:two-component system, NtrC family, response regulator